VKNKLKHFQGPSDTDSKNFPGLCLLPRTIEALKIWTEKIQGPARALKLSYVHLCQVVLG